MKIQKHNFSLMAVAHGKTATEEPVFKQYIGVAAVSIAALNPNLAELKKLTKTEKTDEPEYLGTAKVKNSKGEEIEVPQLKLTFWTKTDPTLPTNRNIDTNIVFTIFLNGGFQYSTKHGIKVKIIDKYGRTAWATEEEVKAHKVPEYANGPANLDKDYHPCYAGEDQLVDFIKCYLGIPEVDVWNNDEQKFVMRKDAEKSECSLDNVKDYFKGNIDEIKEILNYQPNNKVKIVCGVRTTDEGAIYQSVYTSRFIRLGVTNYKFIEKELLALAGTEYGSKAKYSTGKLEEFKEAPTDYSQETSTTKPATDAPDPFKEAVPEAGADDLPF